MGHIPASKRGEVLLMKNMGVTLPQLPPSSAANKLFDSLFVSKLSKNDITAFDDMFPAIKIRAGRVSRQPTAVAA
jgi:hypothetical protein